MLPCTGMRLVPVDEQNGALYGLPEPGKLAAAYLHGGAAVHPEVVLPDVAASDGLRGVVGQVGEEVRGQARICLAHPPGCRFQVWIDPWLLALEAAETVTPAAKPGGAHLLIV